MAENDHDNFRQTQSIERLVQDLTDARVIFSRAAAQKLVMTGPAAIPHLKPLLDFPGADVRRRALWVLSDIWRNSGRTAIQLIPLFAAALDDDTPELQEIAWSALLQTSGPKVRGLFLERLKRSSDGRKHAKNRIVTTAQALAQLAETDPHPDLRQALPTLRRLAVEWLPDPRRRYFVQAIHAIQNATVTAHLPLPAAAPAPERETLPVPAAPEPINANELPLPAEIVEAEGQLRKGGFLRVCYNRAISHFKKEADL